MKIVKEFRLWVKHGQLMDKAFIGLGINRENVYIANIVKCRPPANRVPHEDEAAACLDYLRNLNQIFV
jgi:DNA polymerase